MDHAGHKVSFATIGAYLRGDHGTPDDSTLVAFAAVFDELDLVELRRLARVPAGEGDPYIPPADASRLSRTQRNAVDAVIAAMLEPGTTGATGSSGKHDRPTGPDGAATVTKLPPGGGRKLATERRQAARREDQ